MDEWRILAASIFSPYNKLKSEKITFKSLKLILGVYLEVFQLHYFLQSYKVSHQKPDLKFRFLNNTIDNVRQRTLRSGKLPQRTYWEMQI